jgi:O-acetylhomoserine/O-acetylserine sulfhydrylase-like pyridoxal-dependent enzyme
MVEQLRLGMRRWVSDGLAALFMRWRSNGGDTEAERTTRWKGGPSCSVGGVIVDDV